ncbi:MAG: hypothetical protein EP341_09595 [Sphingomonadales bacterium]|nr:MAG: hypothetical protein EP341_09595 [Sphingomonadales bacterium]
MTERPFMQISEGTVEIVDGVLRVFNGEGERVIEIEPSWQQWGRIAELSLYEMRFGRSSENR